MLGTPSTSGIWAPTVTRLALKFTHLPLNPTLFPSSPTHPTSQSPHYLYSTNIGPRPLPQPTQPAHHRNGDRRLLVAVLQTPWHSTQQSLNWVAVSPPTHTRLIPGVSNWIHTAVVAVAGLYKAIAISANIGHQGWRKGPTALCYWTLSNRYSGKTETNSPTSAIK